MNKFFKNLEKFVDKLIPYMIVILLFVILFELFYTELADQYHTLIIIIDGIIIFTFFIDLMFKYYYLKNFKKFIKKHWLDVLVIFPFFLVFRLFKKKYNGIDPAFYL